MFNLAKIFDMAQQAPSNTNVTPPQTHPVKKFFRKLFYLILFAGILFLIGTYFYYGSSSEKGYSAGLLVNFSQKGLIFKTYEGTLNSGSVTAAGGSNTNNNTWSFSVKEDSIAAKLNTIMQSSNKNVSLHYEEKRGKFFWQGETNRFVDAVESVK